MNEARTRRRGTALTAAIHRAALAELARTSFAELSFDRVAAAAGTGKAVLYRRWSDPAELVLAALTDPATGFGAVPDRPHTGRLREDLLEMLGHFVRAMDEPRGHALRPLLAQRNRHPQLYDQVEQLVLRPHREVLLAILREAAQRGEANPERVTDRTAALGPQLLMLAAWQHGRVPREEVEAVVDEILLPLLTCP
ncbi:TetR/AcrR family transcriptional regulator [Amycolatopsis jiangsuensis]|uniref:AcrR family transcriptional regulator n=1 Tax=Amycolatopsis jiangsuensis TaxID=1181879 RepID=A0A840J659_9PSEU|nr:TetR/AcrR family transcriptional regulator [Amycolatopsis jiangsuensis]MBB4688922.1 AcrR family transcriptional regulator [Amycolatopsis jiangsuensis]